MRQGRGDASLSFPMMATKFQLLDRAGSLLAHGERDGDIYRVFSQEFLGGYKAFKDTTAVFAASVGCAIQPEMFQTPADTRQLNLFQGGHKNDGEKHREGQDSSVA